MSPQICYLDTSALIKRYVAETGSSWVRSVVAPETGNLLITSRLTVIEARSALARRRREASISTDDHAFTIGMLTSHGLTQCNWLRRW